MLSNYDCTFNNVAYFQIVNNLEVTGWVDTNTYDALFYKEEIVVFEPENTAPYVYPTNLYEGMEVKKGWLKLNVEGNEYCDKIVFNMYSTTIFNDGLSERKSIDGNTGTLEFDCTDIGDYSLMIESWNNTTQERFEYNIDFKVVDTTKTIDFFAYFMLGMWDGVVETGKGLWSVLSNPIESVKSFASGTAFIVKALIMDGEERDTLYYIWTTTGMDMLTDLEDDEAKETSRKLGKFTAEIMLAVIAEKGVTKASSIIKESAKSGKFGKVGNTWIKFEGKADDFVTGLVGSKSLVDIFKNGKISVDDIKANPKLFSGKTVDDYAEALKEVGYDVMITEASHSRSGAQLIKINNAGGGKNITQVQVSPGGGRHGELPYVKISTSDQGRIKIVDGLESMYKTDGVETATIIFIGGE